MRCPKCGYISFDYNKFCPKCNKDISDEQAKLNLHNYRHNAPSLLGMLVGAGDESSSGFTLDSTTARERAGAAIEDKSPAIEQGLDSVMTNLKSAFLMIQNLNCPRSAWMINPLTWITWDWKMTKYFPLKQTKKK
jgi:hypothetical protein